MLTNFIKKKKKKEEKEKKGESNNVIFLTLFFFLSKHNTTEKNLFYFFFFTSIFLSCKYHRSVASLKNFNFPTQKFNSEGGDLPELKFGTYNIPAEGKNLLGRVEFKPEELYSVGRAMEEVFWLQPNPSWYQLALKLQVSIIFKILKILGK